MGAACCNAEGYTGQAAFACSLLCRLQATAYQRKSATRRTPFQQRFAVQRGVLDFMALPYDLFL